MTDVVNYDLKIYYDSLTGSDYITGYTTGWVVDNYNMSVTTWTKKANLAIILSNTVPGAVGELYSILGRPTYYDKTWQGDNTLKFSPITASCNSTMKTMRREIIAYVKNITTRSIEGIDGWIEIKLDCYVSGSIY